MKAKRIIAGIGLLAIAGAIVINRFTVINFSIVNIILSVIACGLVITGLRSRNFFLTLLPITFIVHRLFGNYSIISKISLPSAMGVTALVAGGLTLIVGGKNRRIGSGNTDRCYINDWSPSGGQGGQGGQGGGQGGQGGKGGLPGFLRGEVGPVQEDGSMQNNYGTPTDDGEDIKITNSFGKLTRYLHSENLKRVKIYNGFGNCIVYYDNVYVDENGSRLEISNGFGQVNVYIPPFYRFRMKQDNGFGSINVFGNSSMDPNAPLIDAKIDNGMGKVNIYFG